MEFINIKTQFRTILIGLILFIFSLTIYFLTVSRDSNNQQINPPGIGTTNYKYTKIDNTYYVDILDAERETSIKQQASSEIKNEDPDAEIIYNYAGADFGKPESFVNQEQKEYEELIRQESQETQETPPNNHIDLDFE